MASTHVSRCSISASTTTVLGGGPAHIGQWKAETHRGCHMQGRALAPLTPAIADGPASIRHRAARCSASRDVISRGPFAVTRRAGPPFQAPLRSRDHQDQGPKAAKAVPEGASEGPASKAEGDAIWELALAMDATLMLQQVDAHRSALATAMAALAEQGSDVLEFITQALDALTQMEGASDKGLTDLKNEQRPTLEELKSFVALAVDLAKLVDGFFGNSLAASGGVPKQLLDEIASFAKVELISGKYVASTPTSGDMCWPSEPAHAMARTLLGADESTMITAKEEQTDSLIIVVEQCKSSVTSLKNGLERLAAVFIEEPKLEEEEEDLGDLQYPGGAFDPLGLPGPSDGGDGRKSLIDSVINWLSDIKTFFTGAARPKPDFDRQKVFFATDREPEPTHRKGAVLAYTWKMLQDPCGAPVTELATGWTNVSIPHQWKNGSKRVPGQMGRAGSSPEYHIVLLPAEYKLFTPYDSGPYSAFYQSLRTEVRNTEVEGNKGELLLFIHGYNVSFNNAIRSAAQLAYDLKNEEGGYGGAVLAYDWASCGATWRYGFLPDIVDNDLARAESSANRLAEVLKGLANYVLPGQEGTKPKKLHIVAHSMGNYVLKKALDSLKGEAAQLAAVRSVTRTVTFAAPDVGRKDFEAMVKLLVPDVVAIENSKVSGEPAVRDTQSPLIATLYCSNGDLALLASSLLRIVAGLNNYEYRAGIFRAWFLQTGHRVCPLLLPNQMDTVDASGFANDLFGHGYFANSRILLAEISHIINSGQRARGRVDLKPVVLGWNQSQCVDCTKLGKWFQIKPAVQSIKQVVAGQG